MATTHTIAGSLPSPSVAKIAIFKLKNMGFDVNKLSVIGKNRLIDSPQRGLWQWPGQIPASDQPDSGTSLFSLLAGAGMLFMQGIGLVVIAGPITGVVATKLHSTIQDGRKTFGGIVGAFDALGIPQREARQSAAQIQAGQLVMLVAGNDRDLCQVRRVLAEITPTTV